jgi:plastocyanin
MRARRSVMAGKRLGLGRVAVVVVAVSLTALVFGCGGNDSKTSEKPSASKPVPTGKTSEGATTVTLGADPGGALRFDAKTLAAKPGKVTIEMKNPAAVEHNVAIEGNGVDETGPIVKDGGTSTVTADLKRGKYEFYCSVDAHAEAGMKGTLEVR